MHKFKFKFGDKVIVKIEGRKRKAFIVKKYDHNKWYIILKSGSWLYISVNAITPDYAGTFTLRKARGGWRYNVQGLNGEPITTSEVLTAKQSATEMHERHYRAYKLIDKTVGK